MSIANGRIDNGISGGDRRCVRGAGIESHPTRSNVDEHLRTSADARIETGTHLILVNGQSLFLENEPFGPP